MDVADLVLTFVILLVLAPILLMLGCTPSKPAPPDDVATQAQLEQYIESVLETGDPPGVSVVVVDKTGPVYRAGFGWADQPREVRATPDTAYQWWSITKILTAVAVLQLAEAGEVDLDAPVKQYLDFFEPKNSEDYEPPTVRQLLSHSACLSDVRMSIVGWIHFDPTDRPRQLVFAEEKLREYGKLVCPPGTQGRYTNLGYVVLAALIERVTGQTYETYVREHVFKPLGMKNTDFVYSMSMREHEAPGSHPKNLMSFLVFTFYLKRERAIREVVDGRYWFRHVYSDQKGSTGAIGPAEDLGRFTTALLRGGELDGARILTPESVALMARPVAIKKGAPRKGMSFGLGWFRGDEDARVVLAHGGGGMTFRGMLQLYPEQELGVAVLANSTYLDGEGGARIARAAARVWQAHLD